MPEQRGGIWLTNAFLLDAHHPVQELCEAEIQNPHSPPENQGPGFSLRKVRNGPSYACASFTTFSSFKLALASVSPRSCQTSVKQTSLPLGQSFSCKTCNNNQNCSACVAWCRIIWKSTSCIIYFHYFPTHWVSNGVCNLPFKVTSFLNAKHLQHLQK